MRDSPLAQLLHNWLGLALQPWEKLENKSSRFGTVNKTLDCSDMCPPFFIDHCLESRKFSTRNPHFKCFYLFKTACVKIHNSLPCSRTESTLNYILNLILRAFFHTTFLILILLYCIVIIPLFIQLNSKVLSFPIWGPPPFFRLFVFP